MNKISKTELTAKEALTRLAHPIFFTDEERKSAYEIVLRSGNASQKESAAKALKMWPIVAKA